MGVRIEFWGDEVERIVVVDPLTGEVLGERDDIEIYPAKHFVTSQEKMELALHDIQVELEEHLGVLNSQGKLLEAQRLESRTKYDLEMMRETGYCGGVENYSRHLARRAAGSSPYTLLDYFPEDYLLFVDESHMTLPQVRGMFFGDRSRKETLVEYGFRLPSALDNRPLNFGEFEERVNQGIYVTATPGPYEYEHSQQIVDLALGGLHVDYRVCQTGGADHLLDHLLNQIQERVQLGQRCLVTTLTKRMAEELADYLREMGVKVHYLHSEIDTLERR